MRRRNREPNRIDRAHARSQAWLRSKPFLVRYVVLAVVYAAVFSIFEGITFAFGESTDWTFVFTMSAIVPLITAMTKGNPGDAHAWARRRFPRTYQYVEGFRDKPDPRLDRFKQPHDDS